MNFPTHFISSGLFLKIHSKFTLLVSWFFLVWGPGSVYAEPQDPRAVCDTQSIMATAWTICLWDEKHSAAELQEAIADGMEKVREIDRWMSEWKPQSLVSQINDNAGIQAVKVSDDLWELLQLSLLHSRLTDGAFDISFNAFFGKYSWKKGSERFPTDSEIRKTLPLVNYKNIELNEKEKSVFLRKPGMRIGFGGVGQGWAVDEVVKVLQGKAISAGFVDGSGDTYFWGRKPGRKLFTVGIGDPRGKGVLFKIYDTDFAVTTAGDTEHFFMRNGKRFHHIIDPHTGHSASNSAQVTVICKRARLCDVADDGIFVLGPEKGKAYAEKIGVEAVIVSPQRKVTLTKGLTSFTSPWGPALKVNF